VAQSGLHQADRRERRFSSWSGRGATGLAIALGEIAASVRPLLQRRPDHGERVMILASDGTPVVFTRKSRYDPGGATRPLAGAVTFNT
jgi:hypothetical protein